jgi:hypothetical protein
MERYDVDGVWLRYVGLPCCSNEYARFLYARVFELVNIDEIMLQTFDRSSIESWIAQHGPVCPVTRTQLPAFAMQLDPNPQLKAEIDQWMRNA